MAGPGRINLTNQFLIAMPGMADDTFKGTVVYLCEHTEKGALGLVINKPIDIKLKNLFEKVELTLDREDLADAPVYFGGPVQTERGFVLHEKLADDAIRFNSTLSVPGGLEMTTSKDVLEALAGGAGPKKVLVTLGYAGWSAGQLEDEILRNGWLTVDAKPEIIFETPVEQRYDRALSLLGVDPRHAYDWFHHSFVDGSASEFQAILAFDLPLFNRNQAARGVAAARQQQAARALEALTRSVRAEVALAASRLASAQDAAQAYAGGLLAGLEENMQLVTEAYRAGKVDFFQLLVIRRETLEARNGYVDALEELEGPAAVRRGAFVVLWRPFIRSASAASNAWPPPKRR